MNGYQGTLDDVVSLPRLLTLEEVGEALKLKRTAIYRLVSSGAISPIKVGAGSKRTVFLEADIRKYLEGQIQAARQAALEAVG